MAVDFSKYIKNIRIDSAYLPTINLPDPFKPGPPNPILQALRPKITIDTTLGEQVIAPYGDPGQSLWPAIKTSLMIASAVFLVRKLMK